MMKAPPREASSSKTAALSIRNRLAIAALVAGVACAGPPGKQGAPGPSGASGDAGTPADGGTPGTSNALTTETCSLCHGMGQIADAITLHKAVSAIPLSRSFATIDSVTIPAAAPRKPTLVFTVRVSAATTSAKVTGLTNFGFTVAQLDTAPTGGITNWRNLINRNYNAASDQSIGGQTESSLPTPNFPQAPQATCSESSGPYTCVLGDDLSIVQPLNPNFGVVNPKPFDPALTTRFGVQSSAPTPGNPATVVAGSRSSPRRPSPPPGTCCPTARWWT